MVHCPDGSNSCQIDWPKRNGCGAQAIPSLFFWEGDDLPQPNWLDFQRMQNGCHSANLSLLRWSATPSEWLRMQPSLCYPSQLPRRLAGTFDSGVGCHDVPCISIGYVHGWPGHFLFHLSSSKFFFHALFYYSASSTMLAKFSEALFPVKYEVSYYICYIDRAI